MGRVSSSCFSFLPPSASLRSPDTPRGLHKVLVMANELDPDCRIISPRLVLIGSLQGELVGLVPRGSFASPSLLKLGLHPRGLLGSIVLQEAHIV